MYFNVNFNVFFKLIKVHVLVSELYVHQNAWCNDKKTIIYNLFVRVTWRSGCMHQWIKAHNEWVKI